MNAAASRSRRRRIARGILLTLHSAGVSGCVSDFFSGAGNWWCVVSPAEVIFQYGGNDADAPGKWAPALPTFTHCREEAEKRKAAVVGWYDQDATTATENICHILTGCSSPKSLPGPVEAALLCRLDCSQPGSSGGSCFTSTPTDSPTAPEPTSSPTAAPTRAPTAPVDPRLESHLSVTVEVDGSRRVVCTGDKDTSGCEPHGIGAGMLLWPKHGAFQSKPMLKLSLGACGTDPCTAHSRAQCRLGCQVSGGGSCAVLSALYGDCGWDKSRWLDTAGKKAQLSLAVPDDCKLNPANFFSLLPGGARDNPCVYRAEFSTGAPYAVDVAFTHFYSSRNDHPSFVGYLQCEGLDAAEWRSTVFCTGLPFYVDDTAPSGSGEPPAANGMPAKYCAPQLNAGADSDTVYAVTPGPAYGGFADVGWNDTHLLVKYTLPTDAPPAGRVPANLLFEFRRQQNAVRRNQSNQSIELPVGWEHRYPVIPPTAASVLRCEGRDSDEVYRCSVEARDDAGGVRAVASDFVIRHLLPQSQCVEKDLVGPWAPHNTPVTADGEGKWLNFTVQRTKTCVKPLLFYVWVTLAASADPWQPVASSDEWGNSVPASAQTPSCNSVPGHCVGYMAINDAAPPTRELYFYGDYESVVFGREAQFLDSCSADPNIGCKCVAVGKGPQLLWGPDWIVVTVRDEAARKVEAAVTAAQEIGLFVNGSGTGSCWYCDGATGHHDDTSDCCALHWRSPPPSTPRPAFAPSDGEDSTGLVIVGVLATVLTLGGVVYSVRKNRTRNLQVWTQFADGPDTGMDELHDTHRGLGGGGETYAAMDEGPTAAGGQSPRTRPAAFSEGPSAGTAPVADDEGPSARRAAPEAAPAEGKWADVDVAN